MGLMDPRVYTRTRAHTTRTRAGLGRVRVCVSVPPGAASATRAGSEREWSGGCFFSTHASRLRLIAHSPLLSGLFPSLLIIVQGLAVAFSWPRRKFSGWKIFASHARTHALVILVTRMFRKKGIVVQKQPHNPTAGVNVGATGVQRGRSGGLFFGHRHIRCSPFLSFAARMLGFGMSVPGPVCGWLRVHCPP
jgi:hypothetical protein